MKSYDVPVKIIFEELYYYNTIFDYFLLMKKFFFQCSLILIKHQKINISY